MNMLAGFQFDDRQPTGARHRQQVENAVFFPSASEDLRVYKSRVQERIHSRHILANQAFQPALRLSAVETMARVRGQWIATHFQLPKKLLQGPPRRRSKFLEVLNSKIHARVLPPRKR